MLRRRWMLLMVLGAVCLFVTYRNIQSRSTNAESLSYEKYGRGTKEQSIVMGLSHTMLEQKQFISPSSTEQIDSYLQMNVTNASRFLSPQLTKVTILPHKVPLRVGDSLRMNIRLFYTDGEPMNTGGDYLRIWLREPDLKANANGYVTDHGNGTYTGVVLLPWKGHPQVIVTIANSRHHVALIMKYVNQHGLLQMMASQFIDSSGEHKEETQCSPKHDAILAECTLEERCNLTMRNYGLPWFCCKPRSAFINCDDIKTVKSNKTTMIHDLTRRISREQKHIRISAFQTRVEEDGNNFTILSSPPRPCGECTPKVTWTHIQPVGYYYNNVWVNRLCKFETSNVTCLRNKRFVLLGDSNSRSIYSELCSMSKSTTLTAHYTKEKPWHKLLMARNTELNIDLMWAPHNPPFYVGPHQPLETMRSVGNWLDRTPHDKPLVVIIHLYYHLTRTTLSVFRAMVKDARAGVDRLLARAPDSKVFIQGPHSITYKDVLEPIDYLRQRHEEIWFLEFMGIHDKIFYIPNWDRTAGNENVNTHPFTKTMADVTEEILSFICRQRS
ncbi:NXPE family member 3-like [Pecten maximus]|uniref:NXPE family member 3-like n=1 Tax=Pecten maximus TaxID=6579 RepID=UPI00145918AC|nr:NXPE family member 3-like [Pecten maximus]